jgi:membrane protease YdiL (CAAX protease family)
MKKIMKKFKVFEEVHPYLYIIVLIFLTMILIVLAYMWGALFQGSERNQYIGQSLTQLVSTLFLVFVIWRLGWFRVSGFTFIGRSQTWMIVLLPLVYVLLKDIYLTTGEFSFDLSNPTLVIWLGLSGFATGLFEETVFRCIVLFYFLRLWGYSKHGVTKSILMAALLYGGFHVLCLAENPLPQTFLFMLTVALAGFFFGVILLHGQSIWIPIVFHGLHETVINLNMAGKNALETPLIIFFMLVTYIPVFLLGIYLLKKIPQIQVSE